ncbi:hypothetical protein LCGC14_2247830, partial [marine sediment metagenome]
RNALLTSVAPTGTISLYAGNVSSGIEPVFAYAYTRKVLQKDGSRTEEEVVDYAVQMWRDTFGDAELPDYFVNAQTLAPADHVKMQAAAQKWVDSSISKTINCPEDISFDAFKEVYMQAYETGCKGCTTYRPNAVTGSVLTVSDGVRPPELSSMGDRLKWAQENAGFATQTDAAAALGIARSRYSNWINGVSDIRKDVAQQIADKFKVPVAWLLFGTETPAPEVIANTDAEPQQPHGDVVYMTEPLDRPSELEGSTYKLKWPGSEHAIYVTVNDLVVGGHRRPFEIFINSKNMEHFAWTVALTRMISAVFRRGGDVSFVVEELKAVFDPRGGAWIEGKYIPSILAAIGGVIERHLIATGFIAGEGLGLKTDPQAEVTTLAPSSAKACSSCGSYELRMVEGCMTCASCGFSKCG